MTTDNSEPPPSEPPADSTPPASPADRPDVVVPQMDRIEKDYQPQDVHKYDRPQDS